MLNNKPIPPLKVPSKTDVHQTATDGLAHSN